MVDYYTELFDPPNFPKPPEQRIEAAARKLPDAVQNWPELTPEQGEYLEPFCLFVDALVETGENQATAIHAVVWLIERSYLESLFGEGNLHESMWRTTPAFWEEWRSTHADKTEGKKERQKPAAKRKRTPKGEVPEWLAKAVLLVHKHPDWSNSRIATEAGISDSSLSRSTAYQNAADIARGYARDGRSGSDTDSRVRKDFDESKFDEDN